MTDLALIWDDDGFAADLLLADGALVTDEGMRTAILISLFTDARAPDGAYLPEEGGDRRGWWGDDHAADGARADGPDAIGSILWLLRRSKRTAANIQLARQAAGAALGWLVRDGIASAVAVDVTAQGEWLKIAVEVDRPDGPGRQRWDFTWNASTGDLAV